ncbi:MAG: hypothetical protein ABT940_04335 [Alphaproteobacteria bacterium]
MSVISNIDLPGPNRRDALAPIAGGPTEAPVGNLKPFAEAEPSFLDLVDVINPLQHLPVVSTIYRHLSGDEMGYAAKVAGDVLYGGVVGLVLSAVDLVVQSESGKNIGDHLWDAVFEGGENGTALAEDQDGTSGERADAPPPDADSSPQTAIPDLATSTTGNVVPIQAGTPPLVPLIPLEPNPVRPAATASAASPVPLVGGHPVFNVAGRVPPSTTPRPTGPHAAGSRAISAPVKEEFMPINPGGQPKFLAVPPRPPAPTQAPLTAAPGPKALLEAQGIAQAAPATPMPGPETGSTPAAAGPGAWFGTAMTSALDKYERSRRLSAPSPAAAP